MTGSAGPDELRIGSRERDAAAHLLGVHLADGRLDTGEYEQRAAAALSAVTRADLRMVFADLPPPDSSAPGPAPERMAGELHARLVREGLLVYEEGLPGSITYHRYRAPGTDWDRKRVRVTGTVAVTWRRIAVWAARAKQVDLPFEHRLRAAVRFDVEQPDVLRIESDAGAFHPQRSGRIVYRLRTGSAGLVRDLCG